MAFANELNCTFDDWKRGIVVPAEGHSFFGKKLCPPRVRRWQLHHQTVGTGHLYQGTYKSFPIEEDDHLDTVLRYVERNAVRPTMVERAEDWTWNSLWRWLHPTEHHEKPILCP